jgi:uncharacterized protein (DUF488 family)
MKNLGKNVSKIWTIGHSTRSIEEFLALLTANNIEAVADVRSLPGSRRYPQFNAETLQVSLAEKGIEYVPLKKLGGRRRSKVDSKNTVWRRKAFRAYADHMETAEFKEGIDELVDLARRRRTVVMCAEAVWWRCHRSMISDYLKASGVIVEHIMDGKHNVIHPFTEAARITNGELTYGPADESSRVVRAPGS